MHAGLFVAVPSLHRCRTFLDHRRLGGLLSDFRIITVVLHTELQNLDKCSHKKLILISKKLASFDAPSMWLWLCELSIRCWSDNNGTVTKINELIGVQFHKKYYTKCMLRILKICKNRLLIEGFAPFLGSTSTPNYMGASRKKSKGEREGGNFFSWGQFGRALNIRRLEVWWKIPQLPESSGSVRGSP